MGLNSLLLAAISFVLLCQVQSGPTGDSEIEILSIEDCGNPATAMVNIVAKLELVNSTTPVASGTITISKTMGNNIQCKGVFDKKTDMGWKENVISMDTENKGICTTLKKFLANDWARVLSAAEPPITDCPVEPGVYKGKDIVAIASLVSLPLQTGKYRLTMRCNQPENRDIEVSCTVVTIDSRPIKQSSK